ncbi:uncharacterized protein LOC117329051 [Pecten maximus]|uniref:uncharacterized protein LOC117329051 n=1 Tax=Pecten maximus TaxID=6579 RepID=UPI0014590702|nr:uncharacterized protein LOC117329051 [Pecten maximus]
MQFRSDVKNVVVTAVIAFILTGCQARPTKQKEVFCDPEDHQYYYYQVHGCRECDRCWSGQEPDLKGADIGMGLHGATKCPRCRECSYGAYNPDGDKYWNCLTCTVCADLGMHEVQPCTPTQNTKCNKTAHSVNDRLVSTSSDFNASTQGGRNNEGHKSYSQSVVDLLTALVVTGVVALIVYILHNRKSKTLRSYKEKQTIPNNEETIPLQPDEKQRTGSCDKEPTEEEDDEEMESYIADEIRNDEIVQVPMVRKRQQHQSCGAYQSIGTGLEKQKGLDGKTLSGRKNPVFYRQLSHPITSGEVGTTERQLDNKRPTPSCERFLARLLAVNERYKEFARHMGIENYEVKLIEEEHKQRNFDAEYLSYKYTSAVLQRQPKLSYHDIYEALAHLGLQEELATLKKKRRSNRL